MALNVEERMRDLDPVEPFEPLDPPIRIELSPAQVVGLDVWACWGPFDSQGNPARIAPVASECEQTTATVLCEAYSLSQRQFKGAAEFRAYDGSGMLRVRREVVTH